MAALQAINWIAGSLFFVFSTIAIVTTYRHYRRIVKQKSTEAILDLERRFDEFKSFLPHLDPASPRFMKELGPAIEKSLSKDSRSIPQDSLIIDLDRFLRFINTLCYVERGSLVGQRSMIRLYYYWLRAIEQKGGEARWVWKYTQRHFTRLARFIDKNSAFIARADEDETWWEKAALWL